MITTTTIVSILVIMLATCVVSFLFGYGVAFSSQKTKIAKQEEQSNTYKAQRDAARTQQHEYHNKLN